MLLPEEKASKLGRCWCLDEKGPKFSYEMTFSEWDLLTEFPELLESVGWGRKERGQEKGGLRKLMLCVFPLPRDSVALLRVWEACCVPHWPSVPLLLRPVEWIFSHFRVWITWSELWAQANSFLGKAWHYPESGSYTKNGCPAPNTTSWWVLPSRCSSSKGTLIP